MRPGNAASQHDLADITAANPILSRLLDWAEQNRENPWATYEIAKKIARRYALQKNGLVARVVRSEQEYNKFIRLLAEKLGI